MYISAAEARVRLIRTGAYTEADAPTEDALELVLEVIIARLEEWLNFSPVAQTYIETMQLGDRGTVLLTQYPVIKVINVWMQRKEIVGDNNPLDPIEIPAVWQPGSSRLLFGSLTSPSTGYRNPVKIEYRAGYEPFPKLFNLTIFSLLTKALQVTGTSGDITFLDQPVKDTAQISLPGGLSKSFFSPSGNSSKEGNGDSQLERALSPLGQYQRKFVL